MSVYNTKGLPFVVFNEKGFYELYDRDGNKIDLAATTIRVTQTAGEIDKIVIVTAANVVTKEQMQNLLTKWNLKNISALTRNH